jgi:hypothetical protein
MQCPNCKYEISSDSKFCQKLRYTYCWTSV